MSAGGLDNFMDFLEAVLDPAHEQHRDMVRWYDGPFVIKHEQRVVDVAVRTRGLSRHPLFKPVLALRPIG